MSAIIYIIDTLLGLALFVVMAAPAAAVDAGGLPQSARPGDRAGSPIPLILPLRRVLPPIGKVDTASVVAVLLVAILEGARCSAGFSDLAARR